MEEVVIPVREKRKLLACVSKLSNPNRFLLEKIVEDERNYRPGPIREQYRRVTAYYPGRRMDIQIRARNEPRSVQGVIRLYDLALFDENGLCIGTVRSSSHLVGEEGKKYTIPEAEMLAYVGALKNVGTFYLETRPYQIDGVKVTKPSLSTSNLADTLSFATDVAERTHSILAQNGTFNPLVRYNPDLGTIKPIEEPKDKKIFRINYT